MADGSSKGHVALAMAAAAATGSRAASDSDSHLAAATSCRGSHHRGFLPTALAIVVYSDDASASPECTPLTAPIAFAR